MGTRYGSLYYYEWKSFNNQQIQLWTCFAGNTNQVRQRTLPTPGPMFNTSLYTGMGDNLNSTRRPEGCGCIILATSFLLYQCYIRFNNVHCTRTK
jgi:hypothetical protein